MILIAGCSGHVGLAIARLAAEQSIPARCFDLQAPAGLDMGGQLEFQQGDIRDAAAVEQAMRGVEAVLFAVGLKRQRRELTHDMVERGGMENVIRAGKNAGLRHILYISALGVGADVPATSLIAKYRTEQLLRDSGIDYTIFRPSGYFCDFAEHFAPQIRKTGSFTVIGTGTTRLQPLDPADLAAAFLQALQADGARNRVFPIAGPEVFTLREIIALVGRVVGRDARVKRLPYPLMNAIFTLMALLTGNRGGKDFLYRMGRDSVWTEADRQAFGAVFKIEFARLEPWLRARLGDGQN